MTCVYQGHNDDLEYEYDTGIWCRYFEQFLLGSQILSLLYIELNAFQIHCISIV